ncbi:GNAT family N-acetyltransferase [Rubrivirga sp. SAORIC476]|uniref:GNAT family N-acetyltransferase n=1 Tax=Rubrivirga sp. SAORIC476 TaxID=1961794 RepID=UPI000BA8F501|nr:GNAT family protein [Rubrivirga sp. SAORIC476]PAP81529.1 GNAT family N-acetyltransferase [Rubrivirga sp. SAORIC476]
MTPVTLEGAHVRLEPLTRAHLDALAEVGLDPDLWTWTASTVRTRDDLAAYVETALAGQADGTALPFATVDRASGRVVGSTRFGNYVAAHRRVEIGWTFVAPPWQRTAVNTEAKLLMMAHAFDTLGLTRVEWKTDALNARSRAAILRLGAIEEGTLRSHMVVRDGRLRDTVYFSVTADEWPAVRDRLTARLAQGAFSTPINTPGSSAGTGSR